MWIAIGRSKLSGLLEKKQRPFILVNKLFLVSHIKGITLGADKEVDEVAGGASGMCVDKTGEIGDWVRNGKAVGVYVTGFRRG